MHVPHSNTTNVLCNLFSLAFGIWCLEAVYFHVMGVMGLCHWYYVILKNFIYSLLQSPLACHILNALSSLSDADVSGADT